MHRIIGQKAAAFKAESWKTFARLYEPNAVFDLTNVVRGPEIWFEVMFHQWNSLDRLAELKAERARRAEPRGVPGMVMHYTSTGGDDAKPYVEAAINGILDRLRHCQRAQDTTMNNAAFALGRKIAGGWPHMIESEIKARFMDACDTLPDDRSSGKPAWTVKHFEEKWQHGLRDGRADPEPWPPKGYNQRGSNPDFWRELFAKSEPVHGTLGEKYFLETRGVDPSPATLMRFHPAVSCSEIGKGAKSPAIMTAYRTRHDAEPMAMHVTYVGTNGSKPALSVRKRTFGKFGGTGAALYLMPPGPRTIVAEGIEKTLKGIQVTGLPGIAAGSAAAMKGMVIPHGVEELIILADRGEDGEQAADILARRAIKLGVEVRGCFPPVEGKDWDECDDDAVTKAIEEAEQWEPAPDDDDGDDGDDGTEEANAFEPTPFTWAEPASIPARAWIYGNHYIRRQAQVTIAASKIGKSGLLIVEALCIASGKAVLGVTVKERCKVWYWNGEDDRDELQRRFTAAMIEYGIEPEDVDGWLFVDNGRELGITIAEQSKLGVIVNEAAKKDIIDRLKALDIGVLFIDPFISCHRVQENDNIAIDTVAKTWAKIASEANTAIELAHHIRKPGGSGGPTTTDDARGGSALIAAVRTARTMTRMTKDEAEKAAITSESERKSIFRLDDAGGNLAPASDATEWYKFHSVTLNNGDSVGVVKTWTRPSVFAENAPGDLLAVQKAIHAGDWRDSPQSTQWAGIAVANALELDLKDKGARDRVKAMLAIWIKNKALKVAPHLDKHRMSKNWIEVDEWAHEAEHPKTVYEPGEEPPDIRKKARRK